MSSLFSTKKLKLGQGFSQLIHRFNIWILKCWSGAAYISTFFPIHKRDGKLGFLKSLDCISKFFPIQQKFWKLKFLSPCLHIWSNGKNGLSVQFLWFFPYAIFFINDPDAQMFLFMKKRLYDPFPWMGFNCLKARTTLRVQFTFYH